MKPAFVIVTTTAYDGETVHHAIRDAHRAGFVRRRLEDGVPIGEVLDGLACDFLDLGEAERYVEGEFGEISDRVSFDVAYPGLPGPDEAAAVAWASVAQKSANTSPAPWADA